MVDDDSTNAIDEVTSEEVVRHENTRVDNNDFLLGDEKRFVHHGQNTVNSGKIIFFLHLLPSATSLG